VDVGQDAATTRQCEAQHPKEECAAAHAMPAAAPLYVNANAAGGGQGAGAAVRGAGAVLEADLLAVCMELVLQRRGRRDGGCWV
jgi:hypothetical protein